jgi:hypothetical protein
MNLTRPSGPSAPVAVIVCNGLIGFQYVGSLVTRDALFLSSVGAASRPLMIALSGALWLALAAVSLRFRRAPLALVVPSTFGASAALMILDATLVASAPAIAATGFFLLTNGLGPILGSFFSIVTNNQLNPRSAKRHLGRILGAGTLGGVLGALVVRQLSPAPAMTLLAGVNLCAGWQLWRQARHHSADAPSDDALRDDVRQITSVSYVRVLATMLLLGSASAAFAEHVMSVQAQLTLGPEALRHWFSTYQASVAVAGFVVQTTLSARAIEALGLGALMSSPSLVLAAGSAGAWMFPSLLAVTAAYGSGSVVHDSLFRKAYEQFFAAVPAKERRAFKPIVDGLFTRLGAAAAAGVIALLTLLWPGQLVSMLLAATILCCGGAVLLARRVPNLYVSSLERRMLDTASDLDLAYAEDLTTRTVMLRTTGAIGEGSNAARTDLAAGEVDDAEIRDIRRLKSRDREAVLGVLRREEAAPPALVPHIIPLLAWDAVAADAINALRRVADERVGELVDALIDPNQDFAVRRRLARVFSVCVSQRAVDGVLLGLDDIRFEVRFQCARSLTAIVEKNPRVRIDPDVIFNVVRQETAVGRAVWDGQRLLDMREERDEHATVEFVRDRANRSLGHVFTLMSLVLPREPVRIAFGALYGNDDQARGTALEYLESVLPPDIFDPLEVYLDVQPSSKIDTGRARAEILADLLRSHQSIGLNLDEVQSRAAAATVPLDRADEK